VMSDIGDSGLSTWHPSAGKYSCEETWSFASCPLGQPEVECSYVPVF
jgi:hypothetical protein